jgi:hypothetical protein
MIGKFTQYMICVSPLLVADSLVANSDKRLSVIKEALCSSSIVSVQPLAWISDS